MARSAGVVRLGDSTTRLGALYLYTFFTAGRFTNMSALLLSTSVLVFALGLLSEQITNLIYKSR